MFSGGIPFCCFMIGQGSNKLGRLPKIVISDFF